MSLGAQLGIPGERLAATVTRLNEFAATGVDLDFHRGETDIERYYGDALVKPNPCLVPLVEPPFLCDRGQPWRNRNQGGLQTAASARAFSESGAVLPGLYALGNCSTSVMGHTYRGAGATLSAFATFGYIAARHATNGEVTESGS
ncbi:MAG: FAD-binding protein [bacterium]|nr:FAD-binding protein [bacterium]